MIKYSFFVIFGIILFLLNIKDRFSVGAKDWGDTCDDDEQCNDDTGIGRCSERGNCICRNTWILQDGTYRLDDKVKICKPPPPTIPKPSDAGAGGACASPIREDTSILVPVYISPDESDDEISISRVDLIDKDRYRFCIITLDTFRDGHYLVVIKDLSNNHVYTLGYGKFKGRRGTISTGFQDIASIGAYSSPNSYTRHHINEFIFEHGYPVTEQAFNSYLHIPWVDLTQEKRDAATILGWNENIWNLILVPFSNLSELKRHINENANTDNCFNKPWGELTQLQKNSAEVFGYNERNWDINLFYYLSQPTKYVKLRKVIDWSELSDIQFKFLKLLKNNIEKNQIRFLNFLGFNLKSDSYHTIEEFIEWIDGERLNDLYLRNQRQNIIFSDAFLCDCSGCCLDGTAIFLSDNTILNKVEEAGLLDEFNSL